MQSLSETSNIEISSYLFEKYKFHTDSNYSDQNHPKKLGQHSFTAFKYTLNRMNIIPQFFKIF